MKKYFFIGFLFLVSSCGDENIDVTDSPCDQVGTACSGGIFAGVIDGRELIVAPSGCNNDPFPTCSGNDFLQLAWSLSSRGDGSYGTSTIDGQDNTQKLIKAFSTDVEAAYFCNNLSVGGRTDWFLPSRLELSRLSQEETTIGGFVGGSLYWSSTEYSSTEAVAVNISSDSSSSPSKENERYIRCVRNNSID